MATAPEGSIFFVLPAGKKPTDTTLHMQQAFQSMCQEQMEPSWITTRECQKVKARNSAEVFVCDPFEGPAFDHLVSLSCRVVGPLCVLMCIQEQEPLPRRPNSLYSLSFRHIVVTCTGLGKDLREEVAQHVCLMGGQVVREFTKSVTHVIAGDVGSKKYHVAANFKIPVMTPEWVTKFWEVEQFKLAHASSPAYDNMHLPTFKGLTISVSQVAFSERAKLKELIHAHGGTYSGELKHNQATHVALLTPSGEKYKYGRSWNLHCVHIRWVYESASAGYALDESLYTLLPITESSTPSKSENNPPAVFDCSVIPVSSLPSTLSETVASDVSFQVKDPLEALDLNYLSKCGQFLDGCSVYLAGFSDPHLERLRRVINLCGGMRFNSYSDGVTHVVVGSEKVDSLERLITENGGSPHVVSVQWLIDSCTAGKLLGVEPYFKPEYMVTINAEEVSPKVQHIRASHQSTEPVKMDDTVKADLSDIVELYRRSKDNTASPQGVTFSNKKEIEHISVQECPNPVEEISMGSDVSKGQDDAVETLFSNMLFQISGFKDEDHAILAEMIEGNGGKILSSKRTQLQEIVKVVPLVTEKEDDDRKCERVTIVTYCWLQMSVHEETLLPYHSNPLFKPFRIAAACKPLSDCVLTFSKYEGAEKECLINLAESLGAKCQNFLVRKASRLRQLLPNTHLIAVEAEGQKYEAASKWGLFIVTKGWLIATATMGEKADEKEFPVGQAASVTEERSSVLSGTNMENNLSNCRKTSDVNITRSDAAAMGATSSGNENDAAAMKASLRDIASLASTPLMSPACNSADSEINPAEMQQTPVQRKRVSLDGIPTPGSMLKSQRIRELIQQGSNSSRSSQAESSDDDFTPSRILGGGFLPRFKLDGALNMLSTPLNCHAEPRTSLSDSMLASVNIKAAVDRFGNNDLLQGAEQTPSPMRKSSLPAENVLSGVTVCIAKKLLPKYKDMKSLIESLGGHYSCNENCTHFVYEAKAGEKTLPRDVKQAKDQGKKLVCPQWVYACRDAGKIVDEADYPFTYNVRMSLSSHVTRVKETKTRHPDKDEHKSLSTELTSHQGTEEGTVLECAHPTNSSLPGTALEVSSPHCATSPVLVSPTSAVQSLDKAHSLAPDKERPTFKEPFIPFKEPVVPLTESQQVITDQVQELMAVARVVSRQQSRRHTSSLFKPQSPPKSSESRRRSGTLPKLPLPDSEADFVGVSWDDPTRRTEMARLAAKLAESESDSDDDDDVFNKPQPPSETVIPARKVFMFSGLSDADKSRYASIATELCGQVVTSKAFESEVTHLITARALKNERFLASVAAGRYVLHHTFLDQSLAAGHFVAEEDYEWGGPQTGAFLASSESSSNTHKAAYCPRKWRLKIQEDGGRCAFVDWKAVVYATNTMKEAIFLRVLRAGGAQVVDGSDNHGITHALFDIGAAEKADINALLEAGAKCVRAEYLGAFLTEDPIPPPEKYLIPEVVALKKKASHSGNSKHCPSDEGMSLRRKRSSDMENRYVGAKISRNC
uniref:Putative dna topoisomerase 2-binding protein 1 n=1 Tax=Ornithodoros turicata TaxID=34597 RepID=A0A2R5LD61_9ACAR